jgi:hypothetical protein
VLLEIHTTRRNKVNYNDWLDALEEVAWVRLASRLDDFDDVDFENLYDQGYTPESAVEFLYEGEDDYDEDEE